MVATTVIIFWASNPWWKGKEACCYPSCWLQTKSKYNRKSSFNRFTITPQQHKTNTKTKKVKRVVSNRYRLVDGAWDRFFLLQVTSCLIKYQLIFIITIYFSLILFSPYRSLPSHFHVGLYPSDEGRESVKHKNRIFSGRCLQMTSKSDVQKVTSKTYVVSPVGIMITVLVLLSAHVKRISALHQTCKMFGYWDPVPM